MLKDEIMFQKEKDSNVQISYTMIIIIGLLIVCLVLNLTGIFVLDKKASLLYMGILLLISIIPVFIILVLKKNNKWTKYMLLVAFSIMCGFSYAVFTHNATILLPIPIVIARIYNSQKLAKYAEYLSLFTMFWGHVLAPYTSIVEVEPLKTQHDSLLYGFLPRAIMLICISKMIYTNLKTYNQTIDQMMEYNEISEKTTNGLKRVFIESHEMLASDNFENFLTNATAAIFRIVKYLKGTRESFGSVVAVKDVSGKFLALNENYIRVDNEINVKDGNIIFELAGSNIKIPLINVENEGNCVISDKYVLITGYEKDELVLFALLDLHLDSNDTAIVDTMKVLYNSLRMCTTAKRVTDAMNYSQEQLIRSLAEMSESKSKETGQHIKRVAEYMRVFGSSICKTNRECDNLACAAMLHDIGKLIVPSDILDKPGKLTAEEFEKIKEHTKYGGELLKDVPGEMMEMARNIAMYHHERWDGKGYNKIKGNNINFYARYVSVIDVFDALISKRCYKEAWPLEQAYNEIVNNSGTQFAPEAVKLFKEKYNELVGIYNKYPDME